MPPGPQQNSRPSLVLGTKTKSGLLYGGCRQTCQMMVEGPTLIGWVMEEGYSRHPLDFVGAAELPSLLHQEALEGVLDQVRQEGHSLTAALTHLLHQFASNQSSSTEQQEASQYWRTFSGPRCRRWLSKQSPCSVSLGIGIRAPSRHVRSWEQQ